MSSSSPSRPSSRRSEAAGPAYLAGLNDEQRAAVTAPDGPLLIIAGAGTGKTRVLAHRIAALLDRGPGLTPDRILALTFSRKAAEEMRHRVEQLLGAHADELAVSTFHAFCHQLLQDHGSDIGLPRRLRLLGHVEQWIALRTLLPDLPEVWERHRHDPTGFIEGTLRFINRVKDELVGPADLAAHVALLTDPAERQRQAEALAVYERYQAALRAAGTLDFGDLVMETLRLFREQPARLAEYQARLPHVLVDEFQDTNVAQITLVATLAGRSRNLSVVGDDDQAIYRFRGASYASFLLFQEWFPDARAVRLTQNYRSNPRLLRTADRLIRGNGQDRYDPKKSLWTERPEGAPAELLVCGDYEQEARAIADAIRALVAAMPVAQRAWRRVAVLYRAHAHRDRLVECLRREQIPHVVIGGSTVLEHEAVQDVLALLRLVHDPSDSVSAFRVLGLPFVGLTLQELVQVTRAAKSQQRSVYETLRAPKAVTLRPPARQRVRQFLKFLHELQRTAARDGVEAVTRRLLEEIGWRPRLRAAVDREAREAVTALSRWYRFVRQAVETDSVRRDLGVFLRDLNYYQEAGGDLKDDAAESGQDGVQLMTIHQAKGLEFDWVIVPSLVQGRFPSRNRPETIPFPVELMKERLPSGDFHLQEERRLCYVAMTRAREGLFLTTVERPYHRPSVFLREVLDDPAAAEDLTRRVLPPPTLEERSEPALSRAELATLAQEQEVLEIVRGFASLDPADAAALDDQLGRLTITARALVTARPAPLPAVIPVPPDLKLSFSQLEAYRFCPLKYQYAYLYQIPTKPTPQMQLGTNVHACLEAFGLRLMAGQTPSQEELLAIYDETWRADGYNDPRLEARDKVYGRQLVADYYEHNRQTLTPPLFVEKPFLLQVGDAWLRGFIDRIDSRPDGRVEVVDYKTGKPKTTAQVGDRLQLTIYAMACRDVLHVTPAAMSFYYLQNNEKLTFPYEEQALVEAAQTITTTAQKIRAGAFAPTPEYGKCRVCDFRAICPSSAAPTV